MDHPDLLIRIYIYFNKALVCETNLLPLIFVKEIQWSKIVLEAIHVEDADRFRVIQQIPALHSSKASDPLGWWLRAGTVG